MQEVITKTLVILAAMVAVVLIYNRFGRKKNKGCGCGCGSNSGDTACNDCPQANGCGQDGKSEPEKEAPES